MRFYRRKGKRLLDLVLVIPAMAVLLPIYLGVALLVRWNLGPGTLFKQQRPGHRSRPFMLLKFRTMRHAQDSKGEPLPDAERLTPFGIWLRNSSLDELPELYNVLKGEMSLVGPRPLLMRYLERYSREQSRRHDVLPGITGWAQINGRNALTWEEKFELDLWYVDHLGPWLDLKILFATIWKVLRREGISSPGHQTMPEFLGTTIDSSGRDE